jgi:hypothetical protein
MARQTPPKGYKMVMVREYKWLEVLPEVHARVKKLAKENRMTIGNYIASLLPPETTTESTKKPKYEYVTTTTRGEK